MRFFSPTVTQVGALQEDATDGLWGREQLSYQQLHLPRSREEFESRPRSTKRASVLLGHPLIIYMGVMSTNKFGKQSPLKIIAKQLERLRRASLESLSQGIEPCSDKECRHHSTKNSALEMDMVPKAALTRVLFVMVIHQPASSQRGFACVRVCLLEDA